MSCDTGDATPAMKTNATARETFFRTVAAGRYSGCFSLPVGVFGVFGVVGALDVAGGEAGARGLLCLFCLEDICLNHHCYLFQRDPGGVLKSKCDAYGYVYAKVNPEVQMLDELAISIRTALPWIYSTGEASEAQHT